MHTATSLAPGLRVAAKAQPLPLPSSPVPADMSLTSVGTIGTGSAPKSGRSMQMQVPVTQEALPLQPTFSHGLPSGTMSPTQLPLASHAAF